MSEAQRLWQLEEENRKLKQLVAEQALDIVGFKAVLSKMYGLPLICKGKMDDGTVWRKCIRPYRS